MTRTLSVIGLGYLGATHAAAMAELGYRVIGVETNPERIAMLQAGRTPFFEPGLDELVARNFASGRLTFTTDAAYAAAEADVHFLCVGTPQANGSDVADTSYLFGAVASLAAHISPNSVIVGKSTVPVGTTVQLRAHFARLAPERNDVAFAWNPEFLQEGHAVDNTLNPDRIVIGVDDPRVETVLRELYAPMIARNTPFLTMDIATAELVKVAANSFLATKISFINAMAEVCEAAGGQVERLAEAIGLDDRIGPKFLRAGVGFGGGCLPKDIRAFRARAEELGAGDAVKFLREVDVINLRRREHAVDLVRELVGDLEAQRILVLGAAFKPNSDDVRDSPALAVAELLAEAGAHVVVHDPKGIPNARRAHPRLDYEDDLATAAKGAVAVVHLTEWSHYTLLDPMELAQHVADQNLVDGRNVLDLQHWVSCGWKVRAFGQSEHGTRA